MVGSYCNCPLCCGFRYSKYYDLETYSAIDLQVNLPNLENKTNIFLRLNDDSDFDFGYLNDHNAFESVFKF